MILPIVPFYVSFEPHLDATRCHEKAVNGVMPTNPPGTARRCAARDCHGTTYGTSRFKLKPPL